MTLPVIYFYKLANAGGGKHVYNVTYWELANHQTVSCPRPRASAASTMRVFAENWLDGLARLWVVLRRRLSHQDLHRLLLHASERVRLADVDVDAPHLHCGLDRRRHHLTRPDHGPMRSVLQQHPGDWTAEHQAQVRAAHQHGHRL